MLLNEEKIINLQNQNRFDRKEVIGSRLEKIQKIINNW